MHVFLNHAEKMQMLLNFLLKLLKIMKYIVLPILMLAATSGFAQTTKGDTLIKKEKRVVKIITADGQVIEKEEPIDKKGDREVKIIVKGENDTKGKEIVVYKKYEISDSADTEMVLDEIRREEDQETPSGTVRKKVIIVDGNDNGRTIRKYEVNVPNIDSLEDKIEEELRKAGVVLDDKMRKAEVIIKEKEEELREKGQSMRKEQEVQVNTEGDTTEVVVGNRRIIISKDANGKSRVIVRENKEEEEIVVEDEGEHEDDCDNHGNCKKHKRKAVDVDLFGLDVGLNNYFTKNRIGQVPAENLDLKTWRSVEVTTHFFPTTLRLFGRGAVNLKSAISLNFNNLMFKKGFIMQPDKDKLTIDPLPNDVTLTKNKLLATYVQVPLMLNFDTNPDREKKSVKLSVGGYLGTLIGSHTKRVDMNDRKDKVRDDFNLNPLKYGLTARFDYRCLDFYVNYNMSTLFAENQGPQTQLVSVGLNLVDF